MRHSAKFTSAALPIAALLIAAITASTSANAQVAGTFQVTNIVSDGFVPAITTDPGFVDPWGVSGGNTLWIDTAVTGFSYLSSVAGVLGSFKAIVPPSSGTGIGQPTGTVQNTTTGFILSNTSKASFLFATLDGTISGWNGGTSATGNHALIAINNSTQSAVYTDLALVTNSTGTFLLAPNFGLAGKVEIYNTTFQPATLAGTFTDPSTPAGYAPYAIKVLGTQVFVTYMLRTTTGTNPYQEILGTNTGFVSVFDVNGNFVARVVTGGNLNAPWGVAIAPAGFGIYGGDLLIGNFGDGLITAYSPTSPYSYLGMVADSSGKALSYPGLWDIFVSTSTAANPNAIYFTAGLAQETHGLFASISNSTTATAPPTFNVSASSQVVTVGVGASATLTLSVAPSNSFAGAVTLACSGLPTGTTCSFSPASLTVSATAPATTTLTLQTSAGTKGYVKTALNSPNRGPWSVSLGLLLPFGSLLALRRSKRFAHLRILGVLAVLLASSALFVGCGGSSTPATPLGTSNVTVTATSGSVVQTTTVAMTVK
ncbi:MAG: TIGR03118 family protein [Acidobacteriota bacterium]|nr:TIGR03118 family protein [Acidobacteriota bacterium]